MRALLFGEGKRDPVRQRDGLHDGEKVVVAVLASAQNAQEEVEFGVGVQNHSEKERVVEA
jgi:hypothetical protein